LCRDITFCLFFNFVQGLTCPDLPTRDSSFLKVGSPYPVACRGGGANGATTPGIQSKVGIQRVKPQKLK